MRDPWFNPALYSWIPGTVYGSLLGVFGGVSGLLASRGQGRMFCLIAGWIFTGIAAVFLAVSVTAYLSGQPYGIWYGFGLPAVLGLFLCPSLLRGMMQRFREAEERRMHAIDVSLK